MTATTDPSSAVLDYISSHPATDSERVWGTEVVESGNPRAPLAYHPRPSSALEMLIGVGRWGPRTFLVQGPRRITFQRFLGAIGSAADVLRSHGVEAGARVVVHAYNAPEMVLAVWASWWAGGVPVLTNRWWSLWELERAIGQADPALVLTDLAEVRPEVDVTQLELEVLAPHLEGDHNHESRTAGDPAPGLPQSEDDPAIVLFTSGSSGSPKGVVLPHRSVVANQHNLLLRSRKLPQSLEEADEQEVMLTSMPLFHIGGVSNFITQLIVGGRLVLTQGRFDPAQILELIEAEGVRRWAGVPTTAARVLGHPDFEDSDLSSLRSFPIGGAPVSDSLLDKMRKKLPQLEERGLSNTWGLTESGGFVTLAVNRDLERYPGTVGRPYPVTELRILNPDEDGVGEVLVRAPTVMLGYLDRQDDGTVDDDGWLHTGDLGRINDEGYLFLEGRLKDIVIRGGENIACAHVEQALLSHPEVTEAAAFGIPHEDLGEELAAAVRLPREATTDEGDLRQHLEPRLAHFEIPTRWLIGTEPLPTLPGEKVDKQALRERLTG